MISFARSFVRQLHAVNDRLFKSFHEFGVRYCGGRIGPFGMEYKGATKQEELKLILNHFIMIRRQKSSVRTQHLKISCSSSANLRVQSSNATMLILPGFKVTTQN
jgi:hypothetical protein